MDFRDNKKESVVFVEKYFSLEGYIVKLIDLHRRNSGVEFSVLAQPWVFIRNPIQIFFPEYRRAYGPSDGRIDFIGRSQI